MEQPRACAKACKAVRKALAKKLTTLKCLTLKIAAPMTRKIAAPFELALLLPRSLLSAIAEAKPANPPPLLLGKLRLQRGLELRGFRHESPPLETLGFKV